MMEKKTLSFDQILDDHIGALGKWQILLFIFVSLASIPPLIQFPQLAFQTPNHHCAQKELATNGWSKDAIHEAVLPTEGLGYSKCFQYNISVSQLLRSGNVSVVRPSNATSVVPCQQGWTFDRSTAPFLHSFTEDFELVCQRKHLIPILSMAYMIGMGIGYPVGGYLGDRYGRSKVWLITCILSFLFSVASALSVNIWMFFIFRIVVGALASIANVAGYVLCMEITNAKHRNTFNFVFHIINDLLGAYAVVVAYFTQHWRIYHVVASVFCLLAVFMVRIVPESPRWLLCRGRIEEAKLVMLGAAKMNGRLKSEEKDIELLLNNDMDEISRSDSSSESTFDDLPGQQNPPRWYRIFTTSPFSKTTLALCIIWMSVTMNYYGLSFFSVRLRGNAYVIAFVGGLMGLPAGVVKFMLYHWFDRRRPLIAILFLGCLTCAGGVVSQIMLEEHVVQVAFATLGIGFSAAGMMMLYTITPELYPTEYRTFATGFLSGSARLGSMLSMVIERMDEIVWPALPMLAFCTAFALSFLMMFFIPANTDCEECSKPIDCPKEKETLSVVPAYCDDTVMGSKLSCVVDLSMSEKV